MNLTGLNNKVLFVLEVVNYANQTPFYLNMSRYGLLSDKVGGLISAKKAGSWDLIKDKYHAIHQSGSYTLSGDSSEDVLEVGGVYINNLVDYKAIDRYVDNLRTKGCHALFYNSYRLDLRGRMYVSEWPINYQLSRIIRACLCIEYLGDIEEAYVLFFKLPLYIKYQKYINI